MRAASCLAGLAGQYLPGQLAGLGIDALDGDLVAEALEAGGMVADLTVVAAALVVVVGSEVLVPHAGIGQELVVDLQPGVAQGDAGLALAAAAGELPVAGALARIGPAGGAAVSPVAAATYLLPFL